jgi:hypothetical protein
MRIFLTGVSCVGKTTVGAKLATLLSRPFFDLDHEIESFFSMPIERLQGKCLTMYAFRQEAAKALTHLLKREESGEAVIALPPSGLMDNYWRVEKAITYFNRTYKRADIAVHLSGLGPEQAAKKVKEMLDKHWQEGNRNQKKLPE